MREPAATGENVMRDQEKLTEDDRLAEVVKGDGAPPKALITPPVVPEPDTPSEEANTTPKLG
jgi:hypothetical protein